MKINFPSLFLTPLDKYRFFFIFGNDSSIFDRAISYIEKRLSASLTTQSERQFLESTHASPSLFSDHSPSKKIFLVSNVTEKVIKKTENVDDGIFIFTSDKARSKSKLVTFFSQASNSLAISFYDSPISTSEFEFLVGEKNIPNGMKGPLLKAYQNDHMGLSSALDKIHLFGEVTEGQYEHFLTPSGVSDDNASVIHGFLLKDLQKVTSYLYSYNSTNIVLLLRSMGRVFQSLYALLPYQNQPQAVTWNSVYPAIFFKDQQVYLGALNKWKAKEIQSFLDTLLDLERQYKFSTASLSKIHQSLLRFCS